MRLLNGVLRVEGALTADPHLFARHIDVSVPGVKSVSSELELMRGGSKGR